MRTVIIIPQREDELYHYGVPGMKWGKRKARYYEITGNRRRTDSSNSSDESGSSSKSATQAQKAARRKKALKVGAAVAGTALAAYGTYKLAKHVQNTRNQAAMKKAQDYISANFLEKSGSSTFSDGRVTTHYTNGLHGTGATRIDIGARGSKTIGKQNAKVVATGRQIYKDATNTKLDRGLAKVVGAGDKVGDTARKAGSAVGSSARKAGNTAKTASGKVVNKTKTAGRTVGNRIADAVNPQYGYIPTTASTTTQRINGPNVTKSVQNYRKVKVRRQ